MVGGRLREPEAERVVGVVGGVDRADLEADAAGVELRPPVAGERLLLAVAVDELGQQVVVRVDDHAGEPNRCDFGNHGGMASAAGTVAGIIILISMIVSVAVVAVLFIWAAKKDGEDDRDVQRRSGSSAAHAWANRPCRRGCPRRGCPQCVGCARPRPK